jgi:hypothetical protein
MTEQITSSTDEKRLYDPNHINGLAADKNYGITINLTETKNDQRISTGSDSKMPESPSLLDPGKSSPSDNISKSPKSQLANLKRNIGPLDRISLMKSVNGIINLEFEVDEALQGVDITDWSQFSQQTTSSNSVKLNKRGHGSFECTRSEDGSEPGSPLEPSSPLYRDAKCRSIDGFDSPIRRRGSELPVENYQKEKLSMGDFVKLRTLGKGSYAEVALVQKLSDNQQYALKSIDKNFMVKVIPVIESYFLGRKAILGLC